MYDSIARQVTASLIKSGRRARRAVETPTRKIAAVAMATALILAGLPANAIQFAMAQACANPVVCENQKTGNPLSDWDLQSGPDTSIVGYTDDISYSVGNTVNFRINTPAATYTIDIYRLGYYAGLGARKVATITPSATLPQAQPACLTDSATGLVDCGNWANSAAWTIPSGTVTGVYFAKLTRTDVGNVGRANHVVFVVRDDASTSDIVFQTSDTTWQAYNDYGGNSLYTSQTQPAGRAFKVSYNRPFNTNISKPESWVFADEEPMIRFLESNGYNVSYISGVDTDRAARTILKQHRAFLSVGHDEYWSAQQRSNVEWARDNGLNLAFFSGNELFWKTRWENSIATGSAPYRTLVSYKETQGGPGASDPLEPAIGTGTWRDTRFGADGGKPENSLTGTIFMVNGTNYQALQVPAAMGKKRFWRNTSVATNAAANQPTTLTANCNCILGYEWDSTLDNGSSPAGLVKMSSSTYDVGTLLLDQGTTFGQGTVTHSITLYKAASGALVFGAGTVNWATGLDNLHSGPPSIPETAMQQATVNLLADMGNIQPGSTLRSGLTPATKSADTTAPTSTITSLANGAHVAGATDVTINGTASDGPGGGVVGGVEISLDGGTTWHPTTGDAGWTYKWRVGSPGPVTIKTRAADDSGNIEAPGAGITVTVDPATCPCTIFRASEAPTPNPSPDPSSIEVGVRFKVDQNGYINGIRFYKEANNGGTHTGTLWNATTGTKMGTVTFSNETATGWQQALFPAPLQVSAGTTYIASYHAPQGNYSVTRNAFASSPIDNAPLHAFKDDPATPNGVYVLSGSTPIAPIWQTFMSTNYWVDAVFNTNRVDTVPPAVISNASASSGTNLALDAKPSVTFSEDVAQATLSLQLQDPSGAIVAGSVGYDQNTFTETLTPSGPLALNTTYTATVAGVTDVSGLPLAAPYTFKLTTPACPCSLFPDSAVPAEASHADAQAVELGTHFRVHVDGFITGIRFYQGPTNTGTHVGNLWTGTGTRLATVTFPSSTTVGWQTATFNPAVAVQPGTDYVISYFAPNGNYAANASYFATIDTDVGPLIAPALLSASNGGASITNGVYAYGATSGFPTNPIGTNYWVDAVFSPSIGGPSVQITAQSVTKVDQSSASLAWTTTKLSDSLVVYGTSSGSYSSSSLLNTQQTASHTMTLTELIPNTQYFYQLRSRDSAGAQATTGELTFTTSPIPDTTPPVISNIVKDTQNSSTKMLITWTTNEPADTQLRYGPDTNYGTTVVLDQGSKVTSHSVPLNNLTPSTTYHFQVLGEDGAHNIGNSPDGTFTTGDVKISGVNAQVANDVTGDTTATISWTTDGPADSVLEYGPDVAYGKGITQTDFVTSHTVELTRLTPGTTYHYQAHSSVNNHTANSGDFTFTTRDHVPPIISAIVTTPVNQTTETITWTTDEASDSRIDYGTSSALGLNVASTQRVTSHSLTLTGLSAGTSYYFTIKSVDAAGNASTTASSTFTSADQTPPQFSTPPSVINITDTTATVTWGTNELSDTTVKYGPTTAFDKTVTNATATLSHSINLPNLTPNTVYHFQALSKDQAGNTAFTTTDLKFTTLPLVDKTPPVISAIVAKPTTNSVTITWTTNEVADTQVLYGTSTTYTSSTMLDLSTVTNHNVSITGLSPNTLYHFQVKSRDVNKNLQSSTDQTFSTLPLPRSLSLNGTTAYATAPNASELNVSDWTVETWIKDEDSAGYYHPPIGLIVKGDVVTGREIPFAIGIAYNQLFLTEKANNSFSYSYYDLALHRVSANSWHHIAVTIKASTRQATLYLDGVQVLQATLTSVTTLGNTDPVTIGRNGASTGYGNFKGKLDDIRIWNVVRTASQIGASYKTELTGAQSGLVANWKFNEGSGTTAADSGSSPQPATLFGGATWSTDVHP